ncbi:cysteine-rich CWC family protein [Reinekea sp. G2M2-21]|uniref:cysteine-rich CWC family protein n=1 Tax=Reinekea sp. G2M2-21 TaxID=2788942 RepID=UPI0018AA7AC1|nr:cysteine-rich CWC family protein [Reinekea sp. G2M2-21]
MTTCPLCQQENHCTANEQCWCFQTDIPTELVAQVPPAAKNKACICRACVEKAQSTFSDAAKNKAAKD